MSKTGDSYRAFTKLLVNLRKTLFWLMESKQRETLRTGCVVSKKKCKKVSEP